MYILYTNICGNYLRLNLLYNLVKNPPKMKLECLATYTLFGNIMSMQSVSLSGSQRDSLLLSFKDAKLSVVEYDLDTHDLRTLSLHYFEEEEMRVSLKMHNMNMFIG